MVCVAELGGLSGATQTRPVLMMEMSPVVQRGGIQNEIKKINKCKSIIIIPRGATGVDV